MVIIIIVSLDNHDDNIKTTILQINIIHALASSYYYIDIRVLSSNIYATVWSRETRLSRCVCEGLALCETNLSLVNSTFAPPQHVGIPARIYRTRLSI